MNHFASGKNQVKDDSLKHSHGSHKVDSQLPPLFLKEQLALSKDQAPWFTCV